MKPFKGHKEIHSKRRIRRLRSLARREMMRPSKTNQRWKKILNKDKGSFPKVLDPKLQSPWFATKMVCSGFRDVKQLHCTWFSSTLCIIYNLPRKSNLFVFTKLFLPRNARGRISRCTSIGTQSTSPPSEPRWALLTFVQNTHATWKWPIKSKGQNYFLV